MEDQRQVFHQFENKYKSLQGKYHRQYLTTATIRAVWFILALVGCIYWANARMSSYIWLTLVIAIPIFLVLVKQHRKIQFRKKIAENLSIINAQEIALLEGNLSSVTDNGESYKKKTHPFSYDLDLFGKGSLFAFINRSHTLSGKDTLAEWLQTYATSEEVVDRQEAVTELSELVEWRQQLQAKSMLADTDRDKLEKLSNWFDQPSQFLGKPLYKTLIIVLPIILISAIVLWALSIVPSAVPFGFFLLNLGVLGKHSNYITNAVEETTKQLSTIQSYRLLLSQVEDQPFQAKKLHSMRQLLLDEPPASQQVLQLEKILNSLEARLNILFSFTVNAVLLFDINYMIKLEKWKEVHRHKLQNWLHIIGEFEALSSLAAYKYAHPDFCMPDVTPTYFRFEAKELGHPLIGSSNRVCNDFSMDMSGQLMLVTGSNMAGKSTFQRTLGVNAVLAMAGAPVCAKEMKISPCRLFTSMRIEDSLEENISSFYAELKRIQQLFELLKEDEQVFFLLDELLRGTNSQDRHKGVKAIIKQLGQTKASGLISTHDLELASLADDAPEKITNFSFGSRIENGKLIFDYKLKKGVCSSFSASALMEQMGIHLE
ncbi:hypothetical protein V6R21_29790 [Limibacter armeniacum]|uniref:MutS-related protein n=1 Tax=Limibacter armeniacum TaxID=466084 RepID=UPI002FE60241